ncbi:MULTISPECIES: NADPH-dependent FMN reductase [unclassified Streptomyces]|uniref:NADPH-dependent FMN reductase n=1 Tax=unclassified Streptomyces TaxID=2593676 RepID=UPI00202E8C9F|nr:MULTISPECIES: NAD(P)H-dependent oxidoreductase [unclassified Streptomyces]MCM1971961.1 NAD(P)H-dependent oxidoreductase [Streptomyces sp. G1]MCX5123472.1 NAD(P)H-dependent oxidoreductase [Streptomyces sp. NBC_00347]MCX5296820.1 NAD(P)H-dependent oxidoreductase [Streptomyces sp. NBC_00193]
MSVATSAATAATAPTAPQPEAPLRVAVILGSVREGRHGPAVADWFLGAAGAVGGLDLDLIDLADVDLPLAMPGWGGSPSPQAAAALAEVSPRLAAAEAFVIVTPEYNHSFPAVLKNLIDWHREEWQAKPAGFVSYGGLGGGLRAVEQLRLVFAELHTVTVRDSVSLHGPWSGLDPDGVPRDTAVAEGAVKGMLGQLAWWGRALRAARASHPYQG